MLRQISQRLFKRDFAPWRPEMNPHFRRQKMLQDIDLVVDIGANIGQFASACRRYGYRGKIASFEPQSCAYEQLRKAAANDPSWTTANHALGESEREAIIQIAGNSVSSSLLPMADAHLRAAPESAYVGEENISLRPLDAVIGEIAAPDDRIYAKIDAQGYEMPILAGMAGCLDRMRMIEIEASIVETYENGSTFDGIYKFMGQQNFAMVSFNPSRFDPDTGVLLWGDAIFAKD